MLLILLGVEPGLPFSKIFTALYGGALNSVCVLGRDTSFTLTFSALCSDKT